MRARKFNLQFSPSLSLRHLLHRKCECHLSNDTFRIESLFIRFTSEKLYTMNESISTESNYNLQHRQFNGKRTIKETYGQLSITFGFM